MQLTRQLASVADTEALGAAMVHGLRPGATVFLHGDLGSGKTTLVRGMLRGLGYAGAVKSPTFTLVEPYRVAGRDIFHFDLYRMQDPEELEFIGMRDYFQGQGIVLVEWAERAADRLPEPDIDVFIQRVDDTRIVQLRSHTDNGAVLLGGLT
jgi:tRNA threonylcarbamoyladenosine biosynthesis protein TsaE